MFEKKAEQTFALGQEVAEIVWNTAQAKAAQGFTPYDTPMIAGAAVIMLVKSMRDHYKMPNTNDLMRQTLHMLINSAAANEFDVTGFTTPEINPFGPTIMVTDGVAKKNQ